MFSEWYTKQCKTPFHPFQRSRRKLDRPADGRLKTKNWKVFFPPKKWKFQKLYEIWSPDFFWDIFRKFPVYHLKRMAYIIDLVIAQDSKIFRSTIYKTVVSPSICLIWQTCGDVVMLPRIRTCLKCLTTIATDTITLQLWLWICWRITVYRTCHILK